MSIVMILEDCILVDRLTSDDFFHGDGFIRSVREDDLFDPSEPQHQLANLAKTVQTTFQRKRILKRLSPRFHTHIDVIHSQPRQRIIQPFDQVLSRKTSRVEIFTTGTKEDLGGDDEVGTLL